MDETLILYKEKYWSVYYSEIMGYEFIWRELTRAEYNKLLRYYTEETDREEYICKSCVLEPEDFDFLECEAGIATTLAIQILIESGFSSVPTGKIQGLMSQYRAEMSSFQNQVSCVIHEAFPVLDIEEIENWPTEKTLWYFSRAEYILSLRGIQLQNTTEQKTDADPLMQIKNNQISGDAGDFAEAKLQKAFMEGKLKF